MNLRDLARMGSFHLAELEAAARVRIANGEKDVIEIRLPPGGSVELLHKDSDEARLIFESADRALRELEEADTETMEDENEFAGDISDEPWDLDDVISLPEE